MSRSARRQEQHDLAADLRRRDLPLPEIAAALRDRYGVNARLAMRTAHGWSQADVAAEWTARWPEDPKSFKSVSYWENWPSPTGHAPSLSVLDRLAQLYSCDVADLLAGWGEHGSARVRPAHEAETLAWQSEHLDLHELTRSVADWADRLPARRRRDLLLKLSTAIALVGSSSGSDELRTRPLGTAAADVLAGRWTSNYTYRSASRDAEFVGRHDLDLGLRRGALVGRSLPHSDGSTLEIELSVDGSVATGTWTERTSPSGHYRAATYQGVLQLVVDPTGHAMNGMWLGISKRYTINAGAWRLERSGPVTTATTVEGAEISPPATIAKSANIIFPT